VFLLKRSPLLFALVLGLFLAFSPVLRAEELKPLPELSREFDLAGYAASTDTIKKEFDGIPTLGFEISLPKTWVERSTLGQEYGEMNRYDGPAFGDVRPYFSLKRFQVKRENTARLELIAYLLKQGYVLRSMKEIDDRNVEAMYVVVDDKNDSYAVRTKMRIAGSDMQLAEYAVPVNAFDSQVDQQTFSLSSFKFLKDSEATIEKRVERTYLKALRFNYPASWVFEGEEALTDNRVSIRFSNPGENDIKSGVFRMTLISEGSLKDEIAKPQFKPDIPEMLKAIRKQYEDQGYVIGKLSETRKPELNIPASFGVLDIYELHQKLTKFDTTEKTPASHELWLAVFSVDKPVQKTYIAEMFTPSRTQDIYLWSINSRAFQIILKSIQ